MPSTNTDLSIRIAAFEWLNEQRRIYGDVLPFKLLQYQFVYKGEVVHLVGTTGIWKPKQCKYPISILTSVRGVYDDGPEGMEFINYKYRGDDPYHSDNVGLRNVFKEQLPLIYFQGISRGNYLPIYPVFIQEDDPVNLRILIQADEQSDWLEKSEYPHPDPVRRYLTREVKVRVHQTMFRENVISAYNCQCALCRIKHKPLLDAAHIIPDKSEHGAPVVSNGLSLCKIHHAAFDANLMGITPDYVVKVKHDLLDEIDGPMLQHGIKELHDERLILPRKKIHYPNKENLDVRYQEFLRAG
jgi:putative restriction endonuclease